MDPRTQSSSNLDSTIDRDIYFVTGILLSIAMGASIYVALFLVA